MNFFKLVYGFQNFEGDDSLQTDFHKFVTTMQQRLNNSGKLDGHGNIIRPELYQMKLRLDSSELHKIQFHETDDKKQRAAVHWYLLNHRKILEQADCYNDAFFHGNRVGYDPDSQIPNEWRGGFRSHLRGAIGSVLQDWSDNVGSTRARNTFQDDQISGFAGKLEEFVLFGCTHGWHFGLKKDSPSWLSTFARSGMRMDGFKLHDVLEKNIQAIIKEAAAASHRFRWSIPGFVKQNIKGL